MLAPLRGCLGLDARREAMSRGVFLGVVDGRVPVAGEDREVKRVRVAVTCARMHSASLLGSIALPVIVPSIGSNEIDAAGTVLRF